MKFQGRFGRPLVRVRRHAHVSPSKIAVVCALQLAARNQCGVFCGPNKITREIKEIAHQYAPGALKELARIATQGESEAAARVAARREILDRAYGKAMQPIQGTVDYGISGQLAELFRAMRAIRWVRRLGVVRCWLRTTSSRNDGSWPAHQDCRLSARS